MSLRRRPEASQQQQQQQQQRLHRQISDGDLLADPPHHPPSAERESEEDEIWRKQIAGKLRNLDKPHPHGLRAGLWLTLNYVMANAAKSSRNTAIGITTVLVVVFFIGVLQNIVLRAPLIFLRLAETTAGEMDMVIIPEAVNFDPLLNIDAGVSAIEKFSFFNATDLVARVTSHPEVSGATPRWILRGKVSRADRGSDGEGAQGGAGAEVGGLVTSILICDDEEEERMSIGRGWPHRPLGLGEAHVSASVLRSLGIDANRGQAISLNLGGDKLLSTFNLTASGLKETLIGSVVREGVSLTLNGSRIEGYLSGQGVAVPSGTFPERLQTRVPLAEVIDLERLITSTVDGVSSGDLLSLRLSVVDGVKDTFERYPPIGNIVLLNSRHFLDAFKASFNAIPLVQMLNLASNTNKTGDVESALLIKDTPVTDALLGDDMNQYAFSLVVMYKNRLGAYLKDTQGTHDELTRFANLVGEELGAGLQITLPVHDALIPLKYLRIFLQQIFNSVVFVMISHGCLTVYALLLSDTTARTYEYGMLRMMGMRQGALGQLLMMQAMLYAVPGVLLGLLLSWAASYPILLVISEYSATEPDFSFRVPAIVTAATLGILMSVAGNIVPIRRALSRSLAEGLDLYHKASSEASVRSVRLDQLGLSPSQTTFALGLVFAGGTIYYVIPMAFVLRDFDLLLASLNAILMGTVIGLVVLSVLVQPVLERLVARLIMRGGDAKLQDLVVKNMTSHRDKTRKTALMFTSTLAFLVFAGAMFSLQAESIIGNLKNLLGSDLRVYSQNGPLDEEALEALMIRQRFKGDRAAVAGAPAGAGFGGGDGDGGAAAVSGAVIDHAWASWPIWNVDPPVYRVRIASIVNFPKTYPAELVAVSPNYLDVAYGEYFVTKSTDGCAGLDCVRTLDSSYETAVSTRPSVSRLSILSEPASDRGCSETERGCTNVPPALSGAMAFTALVPASLGDAIQAEIGSAMSLMMACQPTRGYGSAIRTVYLQLLPRALVSKMPGFFFSSYGAAVRLQNPMVIVGLNVYQRLFTICAQAAGIEGMPGLPTRPPKRSLHVRLRPGVTLEERLDLIDKLLPLIDENVVVTDTIDYLDLTRGTVDLMMAFFYVVAAIASLLGFFMLFTTFEANVRDNLWEFGVLRSVGVSSSQLLRIFVYEALSMIIAAILLGATIGITVACTLTLQQNLFTEMPFRLTFPGVLFASVILASIFVAGLGASMPVRTMLPRPIAQVLKGK